MTSPPYKMNRSGLPPSFPPSTIHGTALAASRPPPLTKSPCPVHHTICSDGPVRNVRRKRVNVYPIDLPHSNASNQEARHSKGTPLLFTQSFRLEKLKKTLRPDENMVSVAVVIPGRLRNALHRHNVTISLLNLAKYL